MDQDNNTSNDTPTTTPAESQEPSSTPAFEQPEQTNPVVEPTETPEAAEPVEAPVAAVAEPAPVTAAVAPVAPAPGHGLGIASLIVSLLGAGLVGLILGIVGLKQAKAAGQKNGLALAGIIIGAINIVVGTIIAIVFIAGVAMIASKCADLGSGTHIVDGVTYTCGTSSAQ